MRKAGGVELIVCNRDLTAMTCLRKSFDQAAGEQNISCQYHDFEQVFQKLDAAGTHAVEQAIMVL